ncbi:hypothetical protein AURDEDRAFT_178028 [Auricularia subglabra TFB-10046 SS5]|uniref:MYND-type domain-containing protein n=1 Tax=Auricularia subglabra (strain TFB-10046 / SS5) TaxID=717982 RepID=J0D2M3_AURST|nr:hypothetical protein AURDEDRAFT_178028 [Auricularia subglabra TFB-10046 SS5]
MAFLTRDRSGAPSSALEHVSRAVIHACPFNSSPLHRRCVATYASADCSFTVVTSLSLVVNDCFPTLSNRSVAAKKFKFGSAWPARAQDLLPLGCQGFLALLRWILLIDHMSVVVTLTRVYLWCRPAFYTEFEKSSSREWFRTVILSRYRLSLSQLVASASGSATGTPESSLNMCTVSTMLSFIPDFGRDEWPMWLRLFDDGCAAQLLSFVYTAIPLISEERAPIAAHLRDLAVDLHGCVNIDYFGSMAPDVLRRFDEDNLSSCGRFGHFKSLLERVASRRFCSAPDCPVVNEPYGSTSGNDSQRRFRCGSCRLLQYCSRECQRRHWRNALQPHRDVCSTLRDLREHATPEADVRKFRAACVAANIDVRRMAVIYTNLIGDRVIKHYDRELWHNLVDQMVLMLEALDHVSEHHVALRQQSA